MYKVVSLYKRRADIQITDFFTRIQAFAQTFTTSPGCERYVLSLPLAQGYTKGSLQKTGRVEM
ncbi:hypothetical protein A2G96_16695 [Cupriavidus nantongensis]|uniref:Uncharacterized protein n=1 Tax=Cupriavidus nantongensis TaxID=1796606 RepID=A0A142JMD1_9BURK|nr:hypothetical protein A2G96_16695 [Cupriavidus nantongensis]